PSATYFVR
nr:RecName: Full=Unknown protein 4 [Zinnia elegans]